MSWNLLSTWNRIALIWLGLTLLFILTVWIVRVLHGRSLKLQLPQVFVLGLSAGAIMSGFQLLCKAITEQKLQSQDCLGGFENLVALMLGAVAVIWIAGSEVVKLFDDPPTRR
jgi:hypothetical protein